VHYRYNNGVSRIAFCSQWGHSSLHSAAISGHVNVIKALLNKGAHIEARTKVVLISLCFLTYFLV